MRKKIEVLLSAIESEYAVKIIYACESGSRAWGFASKDSDYDVRFLYAHPPDWYLSIWEKQDVIEYVNDGVLDITGWDIRKALQLLRKSNAPLREWLSSPTTYRTLNEAIEPVRELAQKSFLPESLCHHYLSMAKKSLLSLQEKKHVKIKSYLYALRPLLCSQWIIQYHTQPPMLIDELLSTCLSDQPDEIRSYVHHLIKKKKVGEETTFVERKSFFETYLANQLVELESKVPKNPEKPPLEVFDQVFQHIVKMCLS
jgi:predicted nucleotidyltransferase